MTKEESRPEDDVAELVRLRNEKELIELRSKIEELSAPWWRRAGVIATVTALAAAVLPITTAIQEHYRNEREFALQQAKQLSDSTLQQAKQQNDIALQQAKQEFDIRLAYLDRFEAPGHRMQTLRFLLATSNDSRLLMWAREEQKYVQGQLDKIEEEIAAINKTLAAAPPGQMADELKKQREELNKLKERTGRIPPPGSSSVPK
jgi:hypothetical protein